MNTLKIFPVVLILAGLLAGGCATKKRGYSHRDEYDSVKVDQMVGNTVNVPVMSKTLVCLNARRETRQPIPTTNYAVSYVTNISLSTVTNQTVTVITNVTRTLATNLLQSLIVNTNPVGLFADPTVTAETNQFTGLGSPLPTIRTNNSLTSAQNLTLSKANNQTVTTANHQTQLTRQITVNTNNVELTSAENHLITAETNNVVNTFTNITITAVTNAVVNAAPNLVRDYYLYTEYTPPPDFTLAQGESLILLVDGVRHGFSTTNSNTAFVARKGFVSNLYKVPGELLVDIANAKEVKMRLKGVNNVIERELNMFSRANFKKFLIRYFTPEAAMPESPASAVELKKQPTQTQAGL